MDSLLDRFAEALASLEQPDFLQDEANAPAVFWSDELLREWQECASNSNPEYADYLLLEKNAWDLVQILFSSVIHCSNPVA